MTPEDLEKIRQFFASQRSSGQLRGGDFDTSPRMTMTTPEEYLRRSRLGETPTIKGPPGYDGFVDSGTGERGYMGFKYMPVSMDVPVNTTEYLQRDRADGEIPESETPIIEGESSGYDGFVDSGTGERGYMGFKYMPSPMDVPVNTAYMPPPTAAPVNTAYMPPPQAAPANTAYMPPPTAAPVNTAYNPIRRSPSSASTVFNPQALPVATTTAPSYGMSTPTYGMSTPTYGTAKAPTYRDQASYSPNQAGKYKVDGPRLRNTGGLFNDLNAFFGRPQP